MTEFHEAANIFPMEDESIDELAADIKKHGLQHPVEFCGGKIIDGRRRWTACRMAGVTAQTVEVNPDDPVAYVLSLNLHRRHLTPSQRSMVGARAREIYDRAAKERQSESGKVHGRGKVVENLPPPIDSGKSRDATGKAVGVSGKSIDYATRVLNRAEPEVIAAVDAGKMAVSTAAILATEPREVQVEEATKPKRNRTYNSVSKRPEESEPELEPESRERRGVGVIRANEAINCLIRIPKNDALRRRGFQIVMDWIKTN